MTPKKQRIAIASACGWREIRMSNPWECSDPGQPRIDLCGVPPSEPHRDLLPDYLNDLNAMHEAEINRIVGDDEREFVYRCALDKICGHDRALIHFSTAAQRAEAFLRTIGKWEEEA